MVLISIHLRVAALALTTLLVSPVRAGPGDEVCFPLYREAGAVPGTSSCPLRASAANIGMGTFYCTSSSGSISHIPRYCGTVPKDLGKCVATPKPISIGTGNKFLEEMDLKSDDGLLSLTRFYNSTPAAALGSMFGRSWRSSFESRVEVISEGAAVTRPDGRILYFTRASGIYKPNPDVNDHLVRLPATGTLTGWQFADAARSVLEQYNEKGRITRLTRIDGRSLAYTYSTSETPSSTAPGLGYLITVADDLGRSLSFVYNGTTKKVASITTQEGRSLMFGYDAQANLNAVTFPDGRVKRYFYDEAAFNGGQSQPYALTGVEDETGARVMNYWYDANGRAVHEQQLAQPGVGVNEYDVRYDTLVGFDDTTRTTNTVGQTTLTAPNGSKYVYKFAAVQGVARLTSISQPGGAGCLASSGALTYDINGNIRSRDDFTGSRACYASDLGRNLNTTKVEGLPNTAVCSDMLTANMALPAGSRKTSNEWHPEWRLPVRIAEAGKRITYVYNGQPDPTASNATATCAPVTAVLPDGKPIAVLCKQVEHATTDANGSLGFTAALQAGVAARIRQWTHNQGGQVLTEVDPNNRTSSYAYYADTNFTGAPPNATGHRAGDLQSITDAAGHTTQFTQYDSAGRNLQMVDAKGVVTDTVYTPRGWLASTTVTPPGGVARATSYTYNNTGQLTGVSLPDSTSLSYSYDAARRLTGITDAKGNTITYTLDNMGNRVGEQLKDPQGNLQRNITRVYDALNRVEKVTGAVN